MQRRRHARRPSAAATKPGRVARPRRLAERSACAVGDGGDLPSAQLAGGAHRRRPRRRPRLARLPQFLLDHALQPGVPLRALGRLARRRDRAGELISPCYRRRRGTSGRRVVPPKPARWSAPERIYVIALFALSWALIGALLLRRGSAAAGRRLARPRRHFSWLTGSSRSASVTGSRTSATTLSTASRKSRASSCSAPLHAALINGLASFIYPWHRLLKGVPPRDVAYAALNNSGLMAAAILLAGSLYAALGGAVPLTGLTGSSIVALIALLLDVAATQRRRNARAARARPPRSQRILSTAFRTRSSSGPAQPRCSWR